MEIFFPWYPRRVHAVYLLIVLVLMLFIAVVPVSASRAMARDKACAANQRVIAGAIEMYNMDKPVMVRGLNPAILRLLWDEKYLKTLPECPQGGFYSGSDLNLEKVSLISKISCSVHGNCEEVSRRSADEARVAMLRQTILSGTVAAALLIILAFIFVGRTRTVSNKSESAD